MARSIVGRGGDRLLQSSYADRSADTDTGTSFAILAESAQTVGIHDLGLLRGDGVFEATRVVDGRAVALAYHLRRLHYSLNHLDLPGLASLNLWRQTVEHFLAEYADPETRLLLRIVITRGVEQHGPGADPARPTILFILEQAPDTGAEKPLRATLLSRGVPSGYGSDAPWLLAGVKTLSYATNMATNRYVASQGYDLAIYRTTDEHVLEAPNANIVARFGDTLRTPDPRIGILPGTTLELFFRHARQLGLETEFANLSTSDLLASDSAYSLGGGRVRSIASIDETPLTVDKGLLESTQRFLVSPEVYQEDWKASANFLMPVPE